MLRSHPLNRFKEGKKLNDNRASYKEIKIYIPCEAAQKNKVELLQASQCSRN